MILGRAVGRHFSLATKPHKSVKVNVGDLVEYVNFYGNHHPCRLAYVCEVKELFDENEKCNKLGVLEMESGYFAIKDERFIQFHIPKAGDYGGKNCVNEFVIKVKRYLEENHELIERIIADHLGKGPGKCSLIYEWDIFNKINNGEADVDKVIVIYAIHLYLQSHTKRYGKDSQYRLGEIDGFTFAGPYFLRNETVGDDVIEQILSTPWVDYLGNPLLETYFPKKRDFQFFLGREGKKELEKLLLPLGKLVNLPRLQSGLFCSKDVKFDDSFKGGLVGRHLDKVNELDLLKVDEVDRVIFEEMAFAIDPPGTRVVDDAISIRREGQDTWIDVHIADPTSKISFDSKYDLIARQRVCSLYSPVKSDNFEMLPGGASLRFSLISAAKTVTISMKPNTRGEILDFKVRKGIVKNLQKLTYADANESILNNFDLHVMRHRKAREERGYLDLDIPQVNVTVLDGDGDEILLIPSNKHMKSQDIVSECMIMAGNAFANFCKDRNIPIPFRYHQDPLASPDPFKSTEFGPLLEKYRQNRTLLAKLNLVRRFDASAVDLEPRLHWAMQLDTYAKVTSPLRRYFDLLSHHQLQAHILKKPFISKERLSFLLPSIYRHEQYLKRYEKKANFYWKLVHLQRNMIGRQIKGIPLKYNAFDGKLEIFLIDYGMIIYCKTPFRTKFDGEPVDFTVLEVDPFKSFVDLCPSTE